MDIGLMMPMLLSSILLVYGMAVLRVYLRLVAVVNDLNPQHSECSPDRLFKASREAFAQALLDRGDEKSSDVDLRVFIRATREYNKVIEAFFGQRSGFATMSANTIKENTDKMEVAGLGSARALLRHEIAVLRLHTPGRLADPSGAMGLLWTVRGLQLWVFFFQNMLAVRALPRSDPMRHESTRSVLRRSFEQSHGAVASWFSQKAFAMGCLGAGPWEEHAINVAPSLAQAEEDIRTWAVLMDKILARCWCILDHFECNDAPISRQSDVNLKTKPTSANYLTKEGQKGG